MPATTRSKSKSMQFAASQPPQTSEVSATQQISPHPLITPKILEVGPTSSPSPAFAIMKQFNMIATQLQALTGAVETLVARERCGEPAGGDFHLKVWVPHIN